MSGCSFIVDTQLPPVLATFLHRKGHDATHTTDSPGGHLLTDVSIRQMAIDPNRIVVTEDTDFPEHFFVFGSPPNVLYLAIGNIRNADLIDWLDVLLPQIIACFNEGASMVELSRTELISY